MPQEPMFFVIRLLVAGALAAAVALLPGTASAHTELAESNPADGAVMTDAPSEVVLAFTTELSEESAFSVIGPDGETVGEGELDLDIADRNVLRGDVAVTEPGRYVVSYSAAAADGHPAEGEVAFTYRPEDRQPAAPDTALPGRDAPVPLVLGVGLCAIAMALALRGRRAATGRR